MTDAPRALGAIADDVSLTAERLRADHPEHVQAADDLAAVASRLRLTAELERAPRAWGPPVTSPGTDEGRAHRDA